MALEELLPSWRFLLLCSRFKQAGFKPDDLGKREKEVASEIFHGLEWDSPWDVARMIRRARISPPRSALTRHYIENLQLGAELRQHEPWVLSYPMMGDRGHRLQAVFNIFQDRIKPGTTGKLRLDPEVWSLLASLLSDSIIDGLLYDTNLARPLGVARLIAGLSDRPGNAGTILGNYLVNILGRPATLRLLASLPEWRGFDQQ